MAFASDLVDEEGVADQHHGQQAVGGGVEVAVVEAVKPEQGHPVGRGGGGGGCGGTDWKSRSCSVLLTRVEQLDRTTKFAPRIKVRQFGEIDQIMLMCATV